MRLSLSSAALLAAVCLYQDALAAPLDGTPTVSECYVDNGTFLVPSTNCASDEKDQIFDLERLTRFIMVITLLLSSVMVPSTAVALNPIVLNLLVMILLL